MRARSRNEAGHWPTGALVATGLGLGAVGGFLGSLVRERRGVQAAEQAAAAYPPIGGGLPGPRSTQDATVDDGTVAPRSSDRPSGMRS